MYGTMLLLHLLGALIWAGGHLVLVLGFLPGALRTKDTRLLREVEDRYERVGIPALVVQVVSGLWLAHQLVPDVSRWFAFENKVTAHIGMKLILLGATVVLALHARLRLVPRLKDGKVGALAAHMIAVTLFAVLSVVLGAAIRTGGLFR